MGLLSAGRNWLQVRKVTAALEAQLLKYKRGSYNLDLAEDTDDPTKTDPIMAAAVMRLLKKYGDQLVVSRFRGRVSIGWRRNVYDSVSTEERKKLDAEGFYVGADASMDDILTGVDPHKVGDPRAAQKSGDERRRARVRQWARRGWKGDPGWAAWGGDPESVAKLPEFAEYQREQLAREGKTNVGGVDVAIVGPDGSPAK